jgi:small-conductance mechanosensitive channel
MTPDLFAYLSLNWSTWITPERVEKSIRVLVLLGLILPTAWFLSRLVGKFVEKRTNLHYGLMARKFTTYLTTGIILVMVLSDLGFKLTPLLSAAGIVGVAVGFAAQTSLSNFISGLFLISEKPFAVGDVIQMGDTIGSVLSIDLMSVKLRTFDNRYVRIPNAKLIQTEFVNATRFPIRRLDINVGVAYKENIEKVKKALKEVADKNPYCLDEPAAVIIFQKYGDSALEFLLGAWCARTDFLNLRNTIMQEIKERFDADGIEIPFPHRTLYTGEVTAPFPIRIVPPEPAATETPKPDTGPQRAETK